MLFPRSLSGTASLAAHVHVVDLLDHMLNEERDTLRPPMEWWRMGTVKHTYCERVSR